MEKKQIRAVFLNQFKRGRNAIEAAQFVKHSFGKGTTNVRVAQFWYKRFREGDKSLEDKRGRGRPSKVDNYKLKALVAANPRTTIRKMGIELNVSHTTIKNHLELIGKKRRKINGYHLI